MLLNRYGIEVNVFVVFHLDKLIDDPIEVYKFGFVFKLDFRDSI